MPLRVTAEELFPAPSSIEQLDHAIRTHDLGRVAGELISGRSGATVWPVGHDRWRPALRRGATATQIKVGGRAR
jgi:hypothetical protein